MLKNLNLAIVKAFDGSIEKATKFDVELLLNTPYSDDIYEFIEKKTFLLSCMNQYLRDKSVMTARDAINVRGNTRKIQHLMDIQKKIREKKLKDDEALPVLIEQVRLACRWK